MPKQLDDIEFRLCTALSNGIKNSLDYPKAYIQANGALVIECEREIGEFKAFADIFPELCSQYQIDKLAETTAYYTQEQTLNNNRYISKFTFNISPEQFDSLLMAESSAYQGYRNSNGSGSILFLANPLLEAYKTGVICALPVMEMEENQVMLRIGGCNASELISTQLTYYITKYLPAEAYNHSNKRYGHWGAEITECLISGTEGLVNTAIQCFSDTKEHIYQQDMDGFDILRLRQESLAWLQDIDASNEMIYRLLGATSATELTQLKSLEIPVDIYLERLIVTIQEWLKLYEPGKGKKLRTNITNIEIILEKLKEEKKNGEALSSELQNSSASEVNLFAFFQQESGQQNEPFSVISPALPDFP